MNKKSPKVTDYIFCFMEQLYVVGATLGIPAQTIERLPKLSKEQLDKKKQAVSFFIKYFGQCKHLMQKDSDKYYMWLATHEHGGHETNYNQIEREYCQMIFLVKTVFQKAGLEHESCKSQGSCKGQ